MEIKNREIADNITRVMLKTKLNAVKVSKKSGGLVTPSLINKFLKFPDEHNPTIKTLRGIAIATNTEPWMFLIPDFPFEAVERKSLNKISKEGYVLLQAFEEASESTRLDILKQMGYLLRNYDKNHKRSSKVEETVKDYAIL